LFLRGIFTWIFEAAVQRVLREVQVSTKNADVLRKLLLFPPTIQSSIRPDHLPYSLIEILNPGLAGITPIAEQYRSAPYSRISN